jgi:hypothetical protein
VSSDGLAALVDDRARLGREAPPLEETAVVVARGEAGFLALGPSGE